jgi:hypothetical protein
MATEEPISWNEEIKGIEALTLFLFSAKIMLAMIPWIAVLAVITESPQQLHGRPSAGW